MNTISIEALSDLHTNSIAAFKYGSRVYGTFSDKSDYDFIYIVKDDYLKNFSSDQFEFNDENISIYGITKFKQMLNDHHITALECYFLPQIHTYHCDQTFDFKLNLQQLRKSISEKASHSWVKAKKKFEIEDDRKIYIGKKSLFHSMRIIDFGIQIARYGKIEYYNSGVDLWLRIKDIQSEKWKDYEAEFKPLFNEMMSEFRKWAPKKNV